MKVKDAMCHKLIVSDKNDIYSIADMMKKYDIGFIPINVSNKIVGVVTDRDIVLEGICNHTNDLNLNKEIISIDENEDLEKVCEIMKNKKVKRLLVTFESKVVGVISLSDIVSKVSNDLFVNTFKSIYEIDKNEHDYHVQVNEFYL